MGLESRSTGAAFVTLPFFYLIFTYGLAMFFIFSLKNIYIAFFVLPKMPVDVGVS